MMSGLKSYWKQLLGGFASLFPLPFWTKLTRQSLFLPFYHTVSAEPLAHIRHLYSPRTPQAFERDLDYLLRHFQPIDLDTLLAHRLEGKPLEKPSFFLSFDDGLAECATVIAPILQRKGVPATFFLNSHFFDSGAVMFRYRAGWLVEQLATMPVSELKHGFTQAILAYPAYIEAMPAVPRLALLECPYRHLFFLEALTQALGLDFDDYHRRQPIYMNKEQVRGLQAQGFSLGSHSIDHPLYKQLPPAEQQRQTAIAQTFISETFHTAHRVFAFPFTDDGVGADFFRWAFAAGGGAMDMTFGGAGFKYEPDLPQHLQRFPMEAAAAGQSPRRMIQGEYAHYIAKKLLGRHRIVRK